MRHIALLLVLVLAVLAPGAVTAQAPSADDVARLSDEEVRRLLLERLTSEDAAAPASPFNPARTAFLLQQELGQAQTRVGQIAASFPALIALPGEAWARLMHGRAEGTVEQISVRSLKLRHHRGALNTVPFGAVDIIKNYSRE